MLSICLWYTLITTPAIVVFPELNQSLYIGLWLNESIWLIDIFRNLLFQKGEDTYLSAIKYIKNRLAFDTLAILPQLLSGMEVKWVVLKAFRLYLIDYLHWPMQLIAN